MTINERVSDERIANLIEVLSFYSPEDKRLANNESELASALRELQQYRAAAEPVAFRWRWKDDGMNKPGEWIYHDMMHFEAINRQPTRECQLVYAAPQVTSVPPFELFWSEFKHPFAEDDELKSFASEIWNACCGAAPAVQAGQEPIYQLRDVDWYDTDKRTYDTVVNTGGAGRIVYAAPQLPQPAVVPDAIEIDDDFDSAFEHGKAVGWNAYRAAMLQGAEPVSQPDELPLDYLQGHKDGLEWAARLAEANHPQTGDWLFDDPIELAKAIRKGPDMLPAAPKQEAE